MTTPYHEGELAVQARAGMQGMAARVGRSIAPQLTPPLAIFLARQEFLILAAPDAEARPWATVLSGPPGFLHPEGAHTLTVHVQIGNDDPVGVYLRGGTEVGLLAIDLATRQRVRVNGVIEVTGGTLTVHVQRAYGNCPKYIQRRDAEVTLSTGEGVTSDTPGLTDPQRALVAAADTLFIATAYPLGGTDASHRGGPPGFVQVHGSRLEVPDYAGNAMFNTLGNVEATGRAGLLFLDFERDRALHLTGTAQIVWDEDRLRAHPGAQRLVDFTVERAIERPAGTHRTWTLREASPFNPA